MPAETRREFLRRAGAGAAALGGMTCLPGLAPAEKASAEGERPNVLLLMCDQLAAGVLGCYGGPVPTPNIDRIAREGVCFDQATCVTPFCSPTRASIVTGMYPHAHGIVANTPHQPGAGPTAQQGIKTTDVTTERLLHEAGYATHHYGKWHLAGDRLPCYGDMFRPNFEYTRKMAEVFRKTRVGDPARLMQWYNWPLPVEVDRRFQATVDGLGDRWKKAHFAEFIVKMGRLRLPLEQDYDVCVADLTVERIKALADRRFMITCSFNAPHDPNVVPSPHYEAFDPQKIELPANRHVRERRYERQWSRRIVADLGEPGLREFLRVYYGMVKLLDDQVGRIFRTLDESGQTDRTIVVFTADHGDMAGGHGMVWKSTDAFYDEVARVPLLIRYPRRLKRQRSDLAVDLTDLMPTLLELLGRPVPEQVQGQSLVPYLTGRRDASDAPAYSFCERVGRNRKGPRNVQRGTPGSFMIRGRGWKYVRYHRGDQLLYHVAEDPGETRNLIHEPAHRDKRRQLAAEMDTWLRRTGWPG